MTVKLVTDFKKLTKHSDKNTPWRVVIVNAKKLISEKIEVRDKPNRGFTEHPKGIIKNA